MLLKILDGLGLLLLNFVEKRRKSSDDPMTTDTEMVDLMQETTDTRVKIHRVTDGPFSSHESGLTEPEEDEEFWWIEALVEFDGTMHELAVAHSDFDKIYQIVNHTRTHIEPFIMGETDD